MIAQDAAKRSPGYAGLWDSESRMGRHRYGIWCHHSMSTNTKLIIALKVVAHSVLSVVGALVAAFTFYTFWRPLVGHHRYNEIARSPVLIVLLLVVVALWGMVVNRTWHNHWGMLAWVLPALWCCHLFASRGSDAFQTVRGAIATCFLVVAIVYSVGAVLAEVVSRRAVPKPAIPNS